MKLTKQLRLGILFALYISRGGRVTVDSASEGLGCSRLFLHQIARKLLRGNVIMSFRGPTGGYELKGDPTINDIFNALSPINLFPSDNNGLSPQRYPEYRALISYFRSITSALNPLLNRKIRNVMMELVANEVARMDKIPTDSAIN